MSDGVFAVMVGVTVMSGVGFGAWCESVGAGLWMASVYLLALGTAHDLNERMKERRGKG